MMVNLLPWRENSRRQKKRQFWQILSIAILAIFLIIFIWSLGLMRQFQEKQQDTENIRQQIAILKSKADKAEKMQQEKNYLLKQIKELQILHYRSIRPIKLFQELAIIVPKGVYLTELYKQNNNLTLIGETQFDVGIIEFLENVRQSKLLNNPMLQKVNSNNINHGGFILKCQLD